ncbi:MAG: D-alanyl-D-alanine carboxypeptidase family protein [Anderseniella sp.]|nr:D-alanyl-D-alanine carboxypeptidase family protein [Anderseniella sp.]
MNPASNAEQPANLPAVIRRLALSVCAVLLVCAPPAVAQDFDTRATHAIIMDSRSGKVLFKKQPDEPIQPASMSKVMTMLMVFEKLKAGRLKLTDKFRISEDAWRRGGAPSGSSTMYAELGSEVALSDLIQGVVVQSANDGAIAIAEGLAGSEERFAADMTARARELGLTVSTFKNATGLPAEGHVSSARELARLTRYLIEVFPDYYKYYGQPEFTWNNIRQRNRNPLLGDYPGADGVKTGYIREAGYGLIGSAERNGRRLIVVLSGLQSSGARAEEAKRLLDFGFRLFRPVRLFAAGDTVGQARVWGGDASTVRIIAKQDITTLLSDEERATAEAQLVYKGPLVAPVRAGQQIGHVKVLTDGRLVTSAPVYARDSVGVTDSAWSKALDSALFMAFGG